MRRFATAAFSFSAGIFLAVYFFPAVLPCLISGGICAAAALGALWVKGAWRSRLLLAFCGLSAAFFWCAAFTLAIAAPAEEYDASVETVELEVVEYPTLSAYGGKVRVKIKSPRLFGIRAVYYGGEEMGSLAPGSVVTVQAEMAAAENASMKARGEFLMLFPRGEAVVKEGDTPAVCYLPQRFSKAFTDKVKELYNEDMAGFMNALLIGDTEALTSEDRQALTEAGLSHITAVSGLHCSFLLALLGFFVGNFRKGLKAVLGIPLLILYALAVGASPSVVRAAVMIAFVLISPLFARESDPLTALSAALAGILLCDPFAACSVSLQLSFGAVLGLLLVTPRIFEGLAGKGKNTKARGFLLRSLSASCGALIFTVPLTAIYFNVFTVLTPLSNLLCLWAVELAFSFGMLSVAAGFLFAPLGCVLAFAARLFAGYVLWMAQWISRIPYHAVYFTDDRLKYWLIYAYALVLLCFAARQRRGKRTAVAATLMLCALGGCLYASHSEAVTSPLSLKVLDVGQGQCVVLMSADEAVVVDCGSAEPGIDAGALAAEELLRRGYFAPKALILTHLDEDHAGDAAGLWSRARPERVLAPVVAEEELAAAEELRDTGMELTLTAGEKFSFGEAELTVYSPMSGTGGNDGGLAVLCSAGEFDVLITGDMGKEAEYALLSQLPEKDIEVFLAGHHGADSANSEELLWKTAPETVIVSVGENRFGHPGEEALARFHEAGCALYRTDLHGSVSIKGDRG